MGILETLIGWVPQLIGGLVILVAGWFIGGWLGGLLKKLADRAGLDRFTQHAGVNAFGERAGWKEASAGKLLGFIATWWIRVLAILGAVDVFGVPQLSQAVKAIFDYIPTLFAATLILLAGAFLARLARDLVTGLATGADLPVPGTLGLATQAVVLFLTCVAVLQQLNVAAVLAQDLLVALLALVVGAGILGLGLAFGLGGRDAAARVIEDYMRRRGRAGDEVEE